MTSAVCKGLFQSNVALKSRHEALLARIPTSPARSNSSPGNLNYLSLLPDEFNSITTSSSESALDRGRSPSPALSRRHARKVSIAAADVSLLSDQNAELMEKLERLEKEATSSDQAGRRELKRLENEIAFLREALEKTQARSDELEEKVQGAVASQAWRRKKEREAKFRAMRNIGRESLDNDPNNHGGKVQSFAPEGSTFGGPSETFSFFPTTSSPDLNRRQTRGVSADTHASPKTSSLKPHEHALITQLLVKVQELEEANAKILQKQTETTNQLSAVQRDTAHMSRVYECLSDPHSIELELADTQGWEEDEEKDSDGTDESSPAHAVRFRSLKRSLANEMDELQGTCIVRPDFTASGKTRKTVMGLFDSVGPITEGRESDHSSEGDIISNSSPWTEGRDSYSSWSSGLVGGIDTAPSARLSPLHFFSPPSQILAELSPLAGRTTLQAELAQELNGGWGDVQDHNDEDRHNHRHLRISSLYDLSHISVPPSPSPSSRTLARRDSDELDYDVMGHALNKRNSNSDEPTPHNAVLLMPTNSLQLSVEPPTPERRRTYQFHTGEFTDPSISPMPKSPRVKLISDVLRSRSNRWVARRLRNRSAERKHEPVKFDALDLDGYDDKNVDKDEGAISSDVPNPAMNIPKRLMTAVDNMIGGFDSALTGRSSTPKADVYYLDASASDDDQVYAPMTPRPHERRERSRARRRSGGGGGRGAYCQEIDALIDPRAETGRTAMAMQLHLGSSASSPQKGAADHDEHQSFLVKVWLWMQFAIVGFVFLYAMARRGPTNVLADENRRTVARKR